MEQIITAGEIIERLRRGELENPTQLADYLVILSASMNTGGQMELQADITYSQKWIEYRKKCKTDKQCDIEVKLTDEYAIMRKAQIANKTILQTIQSLKKKLQTLNDEMRSGQNY